jgi:phosphate transport system substrate-binding protein
MKTSKLFLILPLIGMLSCGKAKLMIKAEASSCCICNNQRSDTVLPLAQKRSRRVDEKNSDVSVTVVGGGSGVGITAMIGYY